MIKLYKMEYNTEVSLCLNNYCLIPCKIHESGLKFSLSVAKNEYMEADARDETYMTLLIVEKTVEHRLPG